MRRYILLMALLTSTSLVTMYAQREVLSAGGDISSSGGSVAFSIGQVAYINYSGETGSLSQGVQQPNIFNIVGIEDLDQDWTVTLYPNPATQLVYVDLREESIFKKFDQLTIRLFDIQGKLISQKDITEVVTPFPLTGLTEAVYILQICQQQQLLKSFKLYKSN